MAQQNGFLPHPKGFATDAIHHAQEPEKWESMAVVAPIVTAVTYKQQAPGDFKYKYGRSGNPTREVLENVLAKLDNAKHGLAFSSGLGSTSVILGLLKSGDHLISGSSVYGGTYRYFNKVASRNGIKVSFVDFRDVSNFEKSIEKNTKLVWVEMPTNPMMHVVDIKAVSEIARKHNLIVVVDNTFLTPYLLRPLTFGADIVSHSLTKYMNGHSDVLIGGLVTSNSELYEKLKFLQNAMGAVPSPFDCYQVNRGLKTLALRMQQHSKNSLLVANYLEGHPKVEKVNHPGLPSHPQHELFKRQTSGHSGTFSFYIKGTQESAKIFVTAVKLFALAESLGGYESLIAVPSLMTHATVPPEQRAELGITDTLIRISVGLEDAEDLIADLEQAFKAV